jgi:hypothetical protein
MHVLARLASQIPSDPRLREKRPKRAQTDRRNHKKPTIPKNNLFLVIMRAWKMF